MKHLTDFKLFENERGVISYDFDGTLHKSVVGIHPIDFMSPELWAPFPEIMSQLKMDAKTHKIVIVTARPPETNDLVWEFVKKNNLPVEEIFATNNGPKTPVLKKIGAIKHYDDNDELTIPLRDAGIQFVLVDPQKGTQTLMEDANDNNHVRNYEITLTNDKFYISDNTIAAFVKRLYDQDANMRYDPKRNGVLPHAKIIYMKSSMTQQELNPIISKFEKNYDFLKIKAVVKSV